jgi:hypothetical protein
VWVLNIHHKGLTVQSFSNFFLASFLSNWVLPFKQVHGAAGTSIRQELEKKGILEFNHASRQKLRRNSTTPHN